MRYCMKCGSEYGEEAERCATCPDGELGVAGERPGVGRDPTRGRDTRTFVRAATAEDPLTAELFTRALDAAGIPVFAREGRGGTVDLITTGLIADWWEILVPAEDQERAAQLLAYERSRMEATADEAAHAAEEEEAETERETAVRE